MTREHCTCARRPDTVGGHVPPLSAVWFEDGDGVLGAAIVRTG
ncbi:hypothetical protein ACFOVU_08950 [Nocardiopsis sediminis]|uniref:Uncharacterized protein n=1 Tax=Nocardiopsis sediminis TaxID=1778267 RepID=A0ABV8FIW1_9ACTN